MSMADMLAKFAHLAPPKAPAKPIAATAIVPVSALAAQLSDGRRPMPAQPHLANAMQKRNAAHDVHAKRALMRGIVEHQIDTLAHEFMSNIDRIDLVEPQDDCISIRCNQTGMPFINMPANIGQSVTGDIWQVAYTAPIAMYKSAIDYAELLRLAPSAYMVQFLFRLCATPFRTGKSAVQYTSPMDRKAFDRRAWLFDYFNAFDSGTDEERLIFMRLCSVAFMLHRAGLIGTHGVPGAVADAWKFGEFYQLVTTATDDVNNSIDITSFTTRLIELYSLMALHYNPIFWQRNSVEFGISATWADFENIRLLHNTANTPQIRIPIPSKHEIMVDTISEMFAKARREDGYRFGMTQTRATGAEDGDA